MYICFLILVEKGSVVKRGTRLSDGSVDLRELFKLAGKEAAQNYNPSSVCTYLLELAHSLNSFYHEHHVLKADTKELRQARLLLVKSVQIVLRNGLELLGIKAPEKM